MQALDPLLIAAVAEHDALGLIAAQVAERVQAALDALAG